MMNYDDVLMLIFCMYFFSPSISCMNRLGKIICIKGSACVRSSRTYGKPKELIEVQRRKIYYRKT